MCIFARNIDCREGSTEYTQSMVWLVDWGLTSHQQLRSYGDGTSVYSPIRRTGEARDRTCDPGLQGK